jgi:hypothetical protein
MMKMLWVCLLAALLSLCGFAFATAPATLADLTAAISFTDVVAAVLAVGLAIIVFKLVKQGVMIVLRFIGWAK